VLVAYAWQNPLPLLSQIRLVQEALPSGSFWHILQPLYHCTHCAGGAYAPEINGTCAPDMRLLPPSAPAAASNIVIPIFISVVT
jgi:hypothetical protein